MKEIEDLVKRGIITNFTLGRYSDGFYCSMRSVKLEGYVQGRGETPTKAFENTLRHIPDAIAPADILKSLGF